MASVPAAIPYRPAGVYPYTGFMNTDGLFVVNMGRQGIQVSVRNTGGGDLTNARIYLEGFSDVGITFAIQTKAIGTVAAGAEVGIQFTANFTNATPGIAFASFVVEADGHALRRIIKKIFITRVDYDKTTKTYTVKTPQGDMGIVINRAIAAPDPPKDPDPKAGQPPPFAVVIEDVTYVLTPNPPYAGDHGPLMFEDPWWKIALAIVAGLILAGAALYDYFSDGTLDGGSVSVKGTFEETNPSAKCCTSVTSTSQGKQDQVAQGLYSAAGAVATVAIASDDPDLHWRGAEATPPPSGELTVGERVALHIDYPEAPSPGVPFEIKGKWDYERQTTSSVLKHSGQDTRRNTHVLGGYQVDAPATHNRRDGPLVIHASFKQPDGTLYRGGELFVCGHLFSEFGPYRRIAFDDAGRSGDARANDGDYTGSYQFVGEVEDGDPDGRWFLFVIAQDVNTTEQGTDPYDAAHTVGGMVVTPQLELGINKPCQLKHDAEIEVH